MNRRHRRHGLAFALPLLLAACAAPQYVWRDGREIPLEQAVELDAQQAKRAMAAGKTKEGLAQWRTFLTRYPDNRYTDLALYAVGQDAYHRRDCKGAESPLRKIIADRPQSPYADAAKVMMGSCLTRRKEFSASYDILTGVNLQKVDKRYLLNLFYNQRLNSLSLQRHYALLIADANLLPLQSEEKKRGELRQEMAQLVEQKLKEEELKKTVDVFGNQFPADLAWLRLAQITSDRDAANSYLKNFLARFPGHPQAAFARNTLDMAQQGRLVESQKIGVLVPLTGENAVYGEKILQGIMWAGGVFEKSGVEGGGLQFLVRDSEPGPARVEQAIDDLVLREHVIAILGPLFPAESAAAAAKAKVYGVPLISFSQGEGLTGNNPYLFRNSVTKSRLVQALVRGAVGTVGITRLAILYPDHEYGKEMSKLFYQEVLKYPQATITAALPYPAGQKDFAKELKQLAGLEKIQQRPEQTCPPGATLDYIANRKCRPSDQPAAQVDFQALFIPDGLAALHQIAPSLYYYDINGVMILGPNLWNTPRLLEGKSSRYLQGAMFADLFIPTSSNAPFRQQWNERFGEEPDLFNALAVDSARLLIRALLAGASNRAQLRDRLADPGFRLDGVCGTVSFNQQGETTADLSLLLVDGESIVPLGGTAPHAAAPVSSEKTKETIEPWHRKPAAPN